MNGRFDVFAGDVNDVEAHVYARYLGTEIERIVVQGTLRGPYCEGSRTLPAEFRFRRASRPGVAEAVVTDPCTWSPRLPHLYHVDVEARQGERVVAEYHGTIGLRRADS
jgi:hypothetical protein